MNFLSFCFNILKFRYWKSVEKKNPTILKKNFNKDNKWQVLHKERIVLKARKKIVSYMKHVNKQT